MAFRHPGHFPFNCDLVVPTGTNPTTRTTDQQGIFYSFGSPYLFGLSLEEIMFLVWSLRDVTATGSFTDNSGEYATPPTPPTVMDITGGSFSPGYFGNEARGVATMSELVCYKDSFYFTAHFPTNGPSNDDIGNFSFFINAFSPVYVYNGLYYVGMNCGIARAGISPRLDNDACDGSVTINIGPFSRSTTSLRSFYFFDAPWTNSLSMTVSLLSERAKT